MSMFWRRLWSVRAESKSHAAAAAGDDGKVVCATCPDPSKIDHNQRRMNAKKLLNISPECPLSPEETGRCVWAYLHSITTFYHPEYCRDGMKDTLNAISVLYPCETCATDFREYLRDHPPKLDSRDEIQQWLCTAHNAVNKKTGKREFDCSKLRERWA